MKMYQNLKYIKYIKTIKICFYLYINLFIWKNLEGGGGGWGHDPPHLILRFVMYGWRWRP